MAEVTTHYVGHGFVQGRYEAACGKRGVGIVRRSHREAERSARHELERHMEITNCAECRAAEGLA